MKILTNTLSLAEKKFPIGTLVSNKYKESGIVTGYYECRNVNKCLPCPTNFECVQVMVEGKGTTTWCWSLGSAQVPTRFDPFWRRE